MPNGKSSSKNKLFLLLTDKKGDLDQIKQRQLPAGKKGHPATGE
jgi:hypothetical protein